MNEKSPCRDCTDRHYCCWSDCERYKAMKARIRMIDKNRREDRAKWIPVWNRKGRGKYIGIR